MRRTFLKKLRVEILMLSNGHAVDDRVRSTECINYFEIATNKSECELYERVKHMYILHGKRTALTHQQTYTHTHTHIRTYKNAYPPFSIHLNQLYN